MVFDYPSTFKQTVFDKENDFISVFSQLLKLEKHTNLDEVEKLYSSTEHPWLFLMMAASKLLKESKFCIIQMRVSSLIFKFYLTFSYIIFTLKMEPVSKHTIFGLKMMVKSVIGYFPFLNPNKLF